MEMVLIFWITLLLCKLIQGMENQDNFFYGDNSNNVFLNYARNIFGPSQKVKIHQFRFNKWNNMTQHMLLKGQFSKNLVFNKVRFKVPGFKSLQDSRYKRGALHLYNMITCSTGCNPLIYKGYGCFCGFLGSGYPVDGIDGCCKKHDWCYNTSNCPNYLEYVVPYFWKCWGTKPFCAIDHGEFGGPGSCADRLCECDRAFSQCLRKYPCPDKRAFCKSSPLRFFQNAIMLFT